MKFRNPDTNQIFVNICVAYADFCNSRDCDTDCPLDAPTCKDDYQNGNMEANKMKMNKVNAPVMGTYKVQDCPNCGAIPCVDITVKRREAVDSVQYTLSEEVYCTCCGLSGVSVEMWNKLRCVE